MHCTRQRVGCACTIRAVSGRAFGYQMIASRAAFESSWLPLYLWTTCVANGPSIRHQQPFLFFPSFLYPPQSLHLTL